jgi:hypothetical protein
MKIDFTTVDTVEFMMHEHIIDGQVCTLIQPQHIGAKWTQKNKFFRSSLWDSNGELISAGMPKFTNWNENPDNFPVPQSLKNTSIVEKIDGSLLVVSKWRGRHILRTRGTVDAHKLDNGHELVLFEQTHLPNLEPHFECPIPGGTTGISFLFEWVSPVQRIILNYGDSPDWYLVGCVLHDTYQLMSQDWLNKFAEAKGFKRPPCYTFPDVSTLMTNVELWKGKEGVVVYSDHDQTLHKVKGLWYLALHRMKEALASFDKIVDVWSEQGEPSYTNFENFITTQFDYELWQQIRGEASRICDAAKDVQNIVNGMQKYVNETLLPMGDPKNKKVRGQQARQVIASYGITNRANFVFQLLDGKTLDAEARKKLLYQVLKK